MCNNSGKGFEPGFSLEKTIKSIGNRETAIKAIRMFFTLGKTEYLDPLEKSIDESDIEKIFNTSHKLSGLAARLQIQEILDPVKQIVQASRKRKEIDFNKYYSEIVRIFNELKATYGTF